jgi:hypothetical protein
MIRLLSKNSDLEVIFEGTVKDNINMRGLGITTSSNEINKPYVIRVTQDATEITVTYMSTKMYSNLLKLINEGNSFEIISSEDDYFDNCYISQNPTLDKMEDKVKKTYYRKGTLSTGAI